MSAGKLPKGFKFSSIEAVREISDNEQVCYNTFDEPVVCDALSSPKPSTAGPQ